MARCPVCNAAVAGAALQCGTCGAAMSPVGLNAPTQGLPTGTVLQSGAFSVGKILGQGGFGITYLGSDVRLQRSVAIKEFFPEGARRQGTSIVPPATLSITDFTTLRTRFTEEARTIARLSHPNIVQVHSVFEENASSYMVMEYLRGQTLAAMLEQHSPLGEAVVVGYMREVCKALTAVHGAGVLHRDIKPENILVTADGRVALIDFGASRQFASGHTRQMTQVLTPGYAPLEQYGSQARFGPYTDIYSLGATLYHLLTGTAPATATDRAIGLTISAPSELNPQVSRATSDAVMWALAVRADQRPQTVADFVAAFLAGAPPLPPAASQPSSLPAPARRSTGAKPVPTPAQVPNATGPRAFKPFEVQLKQMGEERQQLMASVAPSFPAEDRLRQLESQVAAFGPLLAQLPKQEDTCPGCHQAALSIVRGAFDGTCPLCFNGRLNDRKLDTGQCPVCRSGHLTERYLGTQAFTCPCCRRGVVERKRTLFGIGRSAAASCSFCSAQFTIQGSTARFVSGGHGAASQGLQPGKEQQVDAWQTLSGRSRQAMVCESGCHAEFDVLDSGLWRLEIVAKQDSPGSGYAGKTFYVNAWAKLARGLPLASGDHVCSGCAAEFDYDRKADTLQLFQCPGGVPTWVEPGRSKPTSTRWWVLAGYGKRSLQPGLLCPGCRTEFDFVDIGYKLVWAPIAPLNSRVGQDWARADWQRLSVGLPGGEEERQLRAELTDLQTRKEQATQQFEREQKEHASNLDARIKSTLRDAVIHGQVDNLASLPSGFRIPSTDRLLWCCPAVRHKHSSQGAWLPEHGGQLIITSKAVYFDARPARLWTKPLGQITSVDAEYWGTGKLLVLWVNSLTHPVGFQLVGGTVNATVDGHKSTVDIGTDDIAALIQAQ